MKSESLLCYRAHGFFVQIEKTQIILVQPRPSGSSLGMQVILFGLSLYVHILSRMLNSFLAGGDFCHCRVFSQHFGNMTRPLELGIFASFYTKLGKNTPYNKNKNIKYFVYSTSYSSLTHK